MCANDIMLNPSRHFIKQTDVTGPLNVITFVIFHRDNNRGKLHLYTQPQKPPTQTN